MFDTPNTVPVFRRAVPPGNRAAGFTLIELLTVIAIIAILAGITFGITKGVNEKAARSQAEAELATLSVALESYKRQYGDYPQTGSTGVSPSGNANVTTAQGQLFNALMGKLGPTLVAMEGRSFVDAGKFTLQNTNLPTAGTNTAVANGFVDPWGRLYAYYYRGTSAGNWLNPTYVLYSVGPDGNHNAPTDRGVVNFDHADNLDNIYANR